MHVPIPDALQVLLSSNEGGAPPAPEAMPGVDTAGGLGPVPLPPVQAGGAQGGGGMDWLRQIILPAAMIFMASQSKTMQGPTAAAKILLQREQLRQREETTRTQQAATQAWRNMIMQDNQKNRRLRQELLTHRKETEAAKLADRKKRTELIEAKMNRRGTGAPRISPADKEKIKYFKDRENKLLRKQNSLQKQLALVPAYDDKRKAAIEKSLARVQTQLQNTETSLSRLVLGRSAPQGGRTKKAAPAKVKGRYSDGDIGKTKDGRYFVWSAKQNKWVSTGIQVPEMFGM